MATLIGYYEYDGQKYEIVVNKKANLKRITYSFKKDKFSVSAPYFVSNATILTGLQKYAKSLIDNSKTRLPYDKNGIYIFGDYQEFKDGYVTIFNRTFLYLSIENFYEKIKPYFQKYLTSRVEYYEALMNIAEPYKVNVRFKNTNYGVNSRRTHTLTFNTFLVHFSSEIIDSVVIHELAHHFYFNHSSAFYNVVYQYEQKYWLLKHKLDKRIYK